VARDGHDPPTQDDRLPTFGARSDRPSGTDGAPGGLRSDGGDEPTVDTVAVIGTGSVGTALGRGWADAYDVVFGTRGPDDPDVERLVAETGTRAARPAGAVEGADVVDAGGLDAAIHLEDLARLWIHLAGRHGRGIGFRLLGAADAAGRAGPTGE
jgi:predicted dinucleotide-binding enzyme